MSKKTHYRVAIVGASGAVGQELLRVLEKRNFPIDLQHLYLLGSSRSCGQKHIFCNREYTIEKMNNEFINKHPVDFAFFSAGASVSQEYAPIFMHAQSRVIDNSSAFRMQSNVPLLIPEINAHHLDSQARLFAVPNCSTIIMLMALSPFVNNNRIRRIIMSTYQAASGAGASALQELKEQARLLLDGKDPNADQYQHQWRHFPQTLAFNAMSHNSAVNKETGLNVEEAKIIEETRKILQDPDIEILPTCIRIPTYRAHAQSIYAELENSFQLDEFRQQIHDAPGIILEENHAENIFPMPRTASGKDTVAIGRLRYASCDHNSVSLWCCGDQLLKGAALNAVQIAELLSLNFMRSN